MAAKPWAAQAAAAAAAAAAPETLRVYAAKTPALPFAPIHQTIVIIFPWGLNQAAVVEPLYQHIQDCLGLYMIVHLLQVILCQINISIHQLTKHSKTEFFNFYKNLHKLF